MAGRLLGDGQKMTVRWPEDDSEIARRWMGDGWEMAMEMAVR